MTNWKHVGTPEPKTQGRAKQARIKIKVHGMPIDIPPELDLPAGAPFEGRVQPATMRIPKEIQELFGPLIEMATNAWRLKVRMVDPETGEPKEEARKLYRFVEGLFRALGDAGIQVIDKTGKPYDNGMSEKVINFEQTPGLLREEIINTVRPSIRWKEQPLYHGEIIVGIPVIETPLAAAVAMSPADVVAKPSQVMDATEAAPARGDALPSPVQNELSDTRGSDAACPEQPAAVPAAEPACHEATAPRNPCEQAIQSIDAEKEAAATEPKVVQS